MNNQSLDDLVKRDKKLGRMSGKGKNQAQGNKGKKPNRMQQQRNQVDAKKNNKNQGSGNNQKRAQQQNNQQRQPQRIQGRGADKFKQKNSNNNNQVSQRGRGGRDAGKTVRTPQGGRGRVMEKGVRGKRDQSSRGNQQNDRQQKGGSRQDIATRRLKNLKEKALKKGGNKNTRGDNKVSDSRTVCLKIFNLIRLFLNIEPAIEEDSQLIK